MEGHEQTQQRPRARKRRSGVGLERLLKHRPVHGIHLCVCSARARVRSLTETQGEGGKRGGKGGVGRGLTYQLGEGVEDGMQRSRAAVVR